MKLMTWNINGLRAVSQKGFENFLEKNLPDVIGLQEIKAQKADLCQQLKLWESNYSVHLHPAERKGYSGVALFIRKDSPHQPLQVHYGIGIEKFDVEGRLIWAEFEDCYVMCGYFPNGKEDHSRVDYKLEFTQAVLDKALKLSKKKGVLICGDLNTAHHEIDLARPKTNLNSTGFLPHERAMLTHMEEKGFRDAFRILHPNTRDAYTWWTYRGGCRGKNIGWRLDYFFIDEKIQKRLKSVTHHTEVLGSDHCPVEIILN